MDTIGDFFLQLHAPPLVAGDPRPARVAAAIESLLPGERFDRLPTEHGFVPLDDAARLLAEGASDGKLPLISTEHVAISGFNKDPIISPGRQAILSVNVQVQGSTQRLAAMDALLGELGGVLHAFWGQLGRPEAEQALGEQVHWPFKTKPPPHGLPWLNPDHKLASPLVPPTLAWLSYWSAETATLLGFPDPARDAEWLRWSRPLAGGAWLFRLTEEPLDLSRPEHVATLKAAYDRFPAIGGRVPP